jgi:hypothetical protein
LCTASIVKNAELCYWKKASKFNGNEHLNNESNACNEYKKNSTVQEKTEGVGPIMIPKVFSEDEKNMGKKPVT